MKTKGSEWNQWDLHFHTPSSYDYQDRSVSNSDIIREMEKHGISVFAVTDHHVIDVGRINELKLLGNEKGITVIPGIEFLSDIKGSDPVHFIALFSENANLEHIWGQLRHKTDICRIESEGKKPHEIYCRLDDTSKLVRDELGGIITIHAGSKSNTIENMTNSLPHSVAQKLDTVKLVDIYELGKESDCEGYENIVFPNIKRVIPMIIGSDNHNINKYMRKQKMWIKGSCSFDGLKYALNEPTDRFYMGDKPAVKVRVDSNRTKYIKSLTIERTGRSEPTSVWFENIVIPFNSELVTVIGHKGGGKSAVSDIIAMCADAEHSEDNTFLHKQKFKKRGLADRFSASLEFESGTTTELRNLGHIVDESQESLVRYLPQSYFEKVCNEIDKVDAFREEIEKVVYQYVPVEKRLGRATFKELLDFKKSSVDSEIFKIQEKVHVLNKDIIKFEDQSIPSYKTNLLSKIKVKEEELKSLDESKPIVVEDPSKTSGSEIDKEKKERLDNLQKMLVDNDNKVESLRNGISNRSQLISRYEGINRNLLSKYTELKEILDEANSVAELAGHDISKAMRIEYDENIISSLVSSLADLNRKDQEQVHVESEWEAKAFEDLFLASKSEFLKSQIDNLNAEFTGEQKKYNDYIATLAAWESKRKEIEGDIDSFDSLNYLKSVLDYLDTQLEKELASARESRADLSIEIFSKKSEVKSFYDEVKEEIAKKFEDSDVSSLQIASSFDCSNNFKETILSNVRQNRAGSFYGGEAGAALLQEELIAVTDWNDANSVRVFLDSFIDYLEFDRRPSASPSHRIYIEQVVKNREELYSYIFGLKYIEPHYDLQQNGKKLEQLSPGEKGALLLVFYLLLDKEDIPLVIDQPEDNLDNNSVAKILVPYIKAAKGHRQIIIVTHNPNLAVVADSEQVVKVDLDKENGNKFSFKSGGIEVADIRDEIINVLEGTMPAFAQRKNKYEVY